MSIHKPLSEALGERLLNAAPMKRVTGRGKWVASSSHGPSPGALKATSPMAVSPRPLNVACSGRTCHASEMITRVGRSQDGTRRTWAQHRRPKPDPASGEDPPELFSG